MMSPSVLHFVVLLLTVHVAWLYFYLCGSVLRTPRLAPGRLAAAAAPGDALLDLVMCTAAGIALTGLVSFVFGLTHLLSAYGAALWLVALAVTFTLCGDPPWKRVFWTARYAAWRNAVSPASVIVYAASLPIAFFAAIPDVGSDATVSYTVYAVEWARAHQFTVDMFIRPTYHPDNWILIDTWFAAVGRSDAGGMLSWLTGCLSLLGITGYVSTVGERANAPARAAGAGTAVIAVLAALSLAVSPTFVRFAPSALVDVPIGFMFLASALALVNALRYRRGVDVIELVLCSAFFVGMKVSLAVFAVLFFVAIAVAVRRARWRTRSALAALAAFCVLGSFWYVKDLVQSGDPLAPVLNLTFRGADPKWSRTDWALVSADLQSHEGGPVQRAGIPLDIVLHTTEHQYRGPGVSFMMLALLLPACAVAYLLLRRRRAGRVDAYAFAAVLLFAVGYWMATSYMARYSLEFSAALTAFCGGLLVLAAQRGGYARWAAVACAVVLTIPSPSAGQFYQEMDATDKDYYYNFTDEESWLLARGPVYPEVVYVSDIMHRLHCDDLTVYRPNIETDRLYWTQHGVTAVGDLVGPARYSSFHHAIYDDTLAAYIERFHIGAFIIVPDNPNFPAALARRFDEQARRLGFRTERLPQRPFVMYLSRPLQG